MKPPRQFILWYFHGVDQRILHESTYPGTLARRIGVLAYLGTGDHETYELGALSVPPPPEILPLIRRDEFLAQSENEEFTKTIEAFLADGLLRAVTFDELRARGLDPARMPAQLLVLDRTPLAELAREFGSVQRRADELLSGPAHGLEPADPSLTSVVVAVP